MMRSRSTTSARAALRTLAAKSAKNEFALANDSLAEKARGWIRHVVPLDVFDFTAAILFGIIVGTFSSIYVAAALLIYLPHVGTGGSEPPATVARDSEIPRRREEKVPAEGATARSRG